MGINRIVVALNGIAMVGQREKRPHPNGWSLNQPKNQLRILVDEHTLQMILKSGRPACGPARRIPLLQLQLQGQGLTLLMNIHRQAICSTEKPSSTSLWVWIPLLTPFWVCGVSPTSTQYRLRTPKRNPLKKFHKYDLSNLPSLPVSSIPSPLSCPPI